MRTSGSSNFYVNSRLFQNNCFFQKKGISREEHSRHKEQMHESQEAPGTSMLIKQEVSWRDGLMVCYFIYFLIDFKHLSKYTCTRFLKNQIRSKACNKKQLSWSHSSFLPKCNHSYPFLSQFNILHFKYSCRIFSGPLPVIYVTFNSILRPFTLLSSAVDSTSCCCLCNIRMLHSCHSFPLPSIQLISCVL